MLRTCAHLAGLVYYVWLVHFVFALDPEGDPVVLQRFRDFRPKFFSVWGLVAQAVVLALCVAHDVARLLSLPDTSPARQTVGRLRDLLFVGYAAPLAVTGCLMYAGLCCWDRDIIMPPALDALMPPWLNQAMHSVSTVQVALQLVADPLGVPSLGAATALASVVSTLYIANTLQEYTATGRWLYPVLEVLNWPGRVFLGVFFLAFTLVQVAAFQRAVASRWGIAAGQTGPADLYSKRNKKH